jgi:hypothetical protein
MSPTRGRRADAGRAALPAIKIVGDRSFLPKLHSGRSWIASMPAFCRNYREQIMNKLSLLGGTLGAALLLATAPFSLQWSPAGTLSLSLDKAEARIGRPLTPLSIAGVNRRVHRRAYYGAWAAGAAAAGAAAAGAYYYGQPYYYGRPACGYYPYPPCY